MITFALVCSAASVVIAVSVLVWALCRTAARADSVDEAYNTLPAGRPELRVDTATGSHDEYPHMTDNTRDIVTAYCEAMWQHSTQEQP